MIRTIVGGLGGGCVAAAVSVTLSSAFHPPASASFMIGMVLGVLFGFVGVAVAHSFR